MIIDFKELVARHDWNEKFKITVDDSGIISATEVV